MSDPLGGIPEAWRGRLRRAAIPAWIEPMRATLHHDAFSDPAWIYERKLDGVRALAFREGGRVKLRSRNRKDLGETFPELVEALEGQPKGDFVADGEIVTFRGQVTSFERLQGRLGIEDPQEARRSGIAVSLYLFDLPCLHGVDLRQLPLRARKGVLKRGFDFGGRLHYTPHRNEHGEAWLAEACRKGWEGLIAKHAESTYQSRRSKQWLKLKCARRQEMVIGGYTDPQGSREHFGALLVGYYEKGDLRYAGKVGTGYDADLLERIGSRLERITRKSSPFADPVHEKGVHFVRPALVGEVGFTEWTREGRLRHPRFLGLRPDKEPHEVVRERPV